jgi:exodeoxyribonuclease VIII
MHEILEHAVSPMVSSVQLGGALPTSIITPQVARIEGMSSDDYFGTVGYESNSSLKPILRSTAHYVYEKETPRFDKPHFQLGSAIHCAILEPARFKSDYIIAPVFNNRTNAGKQEKLDFIQQHQGKFIINEDDMECINGIAENVLYHNDAMQLLKAGTSEVSYFWQDPETDIWMRARADSESRFATLDIKSTDDASADGFVKSCAKFGYDMQAYIYSEARRIVTGESKQFAFLAVEKKAPYAVGLYLAPKEMLASGLIRYRESLRRLAEYRANTAARLGYQPDGKLQEMEWPTWAYFR